MADPCDEALNEEVVAIADDALSPEITPEQRLQASQPATKQRMVKLLSPAVRLWLKTQVDSVEELQVEIQSGDRALLSGKIQQVSVAARQVVYQGLQLSFVKVVAQDIQINLGQILRGKPLKLLAPIPIQGEAQIQEHDLNASAQAALLSNALTEFLGQFLQVGLAQKGIPPLQLRSPKIKLTANSVQLSGTCTSADQQVQRVGIQLDLALSNPHTLLFKNLTWLDDVPVSDRIPAAWADFSIDLGEAVQLHHVELKPSEIYCQASLTIMP